MDRKAWIDTVAEVTVTFVRTAFAWFLYNYAIASFLDLPYLAYWQMFAIVVFVGILARK